MDGSRKFVHVTFGTEGAPHDQGLNLVPALEAQRKEAEKYMTYEIYTPRRVRNAGYGWAVEPLPATSITHKGNKKIAELGYHRWKAVVLSLELEKLKDGDYLLYGDGSIQKRHERGFHFQFSELRDLTVEILEHVGFDIVMPKQGHYNPIVYHVKPNVIKELGENHPFSRMAPILMGGFIAIRKSRASVQMVREWLDAMTHTEWVDGDFHGVRDDKFKWWTPEQGIFSVIAANWVRKRIHKIPYNYPDLPSHGYPVKPSTNWELGHLEFLTPENESSFFSLCDGAVSPHGHVRNEFCRQTYIPYADGGW